MTEETEIHAVEIRPENGAIAHHALIGYTESNSIWEAEALDAETPEEGYESRELRRAGRGFSVRRMGTRR